MLEQLKTHSVILEIDVKGALQVREALKGSPVEPVLIMITPPSSQELINRLSGRNSESMTELLKRLKRVDYELSQKDAYDYVIVNDDLNEAKENLEKIIGSEKAKRRL